MKKLCFIFVFALFSALCLCTGASAEEISFTDYLDEKIDNYEEVVEISQYVYDNKWTEDDIKSAVRDYFFSSPRLYFIDNGYTLNGADSTKTRYFLNFTYKYSRDEKKIMDEKLDSGIKKVIEGITPDMSDAEKALYVYDYLILNCGYDTSHNNYSAYNCIVDKKCVCQGYALAYKLILQDYLGIDCEIVLSDSQNHSWNYVKIDGKWYHVDLTGGDGTYQFYDGKSYDVFSKVCHDNFLMSDKKCKEVSGLHRSWKVIGDCGAAKSTLYDNAKWRDSSSPMQYYEGKWYYVISVKEGNKRYSKIYSYDFESRKSKLISKVSAKWYLLRDPSSGEKYAYGKKAYKVSFTRLVIKGDYLYFNTTDCIYRYDLKTDKVKKIYTLKKNKGQQIYGMVLSGEKLKICYKYDTTYKDNYINLRLSK